MACILYVFDSAWSARPIAQISSHSQATCRNKASLLKIIGKKFAETWAGSTLENFFYRVAVSKAGSYYETTRGASLGAWNDYVTIIILSFSLGAIDDLPVWVLRCAFRWELFVYAFPQFGWSQIWLYKFILNLWSLNFNRTRRRTFGASGVFSDGEPKPESLDWTSVLRISSGTPLFPRVSAEGDWARLIGVEVARGSIFMRFGLDSRRSSILYDCFRDFWAAFVGVTGKEIGSGWGRTEDTGWKVGSEELRF